MQPKVASSGVLDIFRGNLTKLGLNTLFIGKNFIRLERVDSTNACCIQLLPDRPPEGTVVWADAQTDGRGQAGNAWHSEPGQNLTFSLILYPAFLQSHEVFYLNKAVSLAIQDLLASLLPDSEVLIKWPNDILVDRKKVAGILIQNQLEGKKLLNSVVGIGLNVNQTEFPDEFKTQATSMKLAGAQDFDREKILEALCSRIEKYFLPLRARNTDGMDRGYLENLYGYQETIRVRIDGKEQERLLVGVEKTGQLALADGNQLQRFEMKEVEFCL